MCFSPEGDLIGGLVVTAIGVDACYHLRGRPEYRLIAPFPILLGLHQIDETFVWWQLQGHVPHALGVVAMWIYLLFAFVALPTLVPTMVLLLEPRDVYKRQVDARRERSRQPLAPQRSHSRGVGARRSRSRSTAHRRSVRALPEDARVGRSRESPRLRKMCIRDRFGALGAGHHELRVH